MDLLGAVQFRLQAIEFGAGAPAGKSLRPSPSKTCADDGHAAALGMTSTL